MAGPDEQPSPEPEDQSAFGGDPDRMVRPGQGQSRDSENFGGYEQDPRKILALHPRDADIIFSSQSSYGGNLTADFREYVKPLSQVYQAVQRYLTGVYRRDDVFYPELTDLHKDLSIYKRSISDKLPMPSEEQLHKYCICLAAQNPPFLHILRELKVQDDARLGFITRYVAPTDKHTDKVIVGYRSTLQTSIQQLKAALIKDGFGTDYVSAFAGARSIAEAPLFTGRADFALRRMYLDEKSFSHIGQHDIANIRRVNQELYKRLYRPLLLQAIRDRLLVNLSCEDIRSAGFPGADRIFDIVLFAETKDLRNRYTALIAFLKPDYLEHRVSGEQIATVQAKRKSGEICEYDCNEEIARMFYEACIREAGPDLREVQFAVEIMKLSDWARQSERQEQKQSEARELKDVVDKIRQAGGLVRYRDKKQGLSEQLARQMLKGRIPGVLAVTEPRIPPEQIGSDLDLHQFDNVWLIAKDRQVTAKAIDKAIEHFESQEDSYLVRVLEEILGVGRVSEAELKNYVAPVFLGKLRHALRRAYAQYLPWWSRLFLTLTSSELSEERMQRIKAELRSREERRLGRFKQTADVSARKQAQADVRKLARERAADGDRSASTSQGTEGADVGGGGQLGPAEGQALEQIRDYLDRSWDRGQYPTREDLASLAAGADAGGVNKVLGLIDVGAASVKEVARIPVSGDADVYATRSYLQKNRAELMERCELKLQEETVIIHDNREKLLRGSGDRKTFFQSLLDYLKYKVREG